MTAPSQRGLTGPCAAGLCQACTAPGEVRVPGSAVPAVVNRCAHDCHKGQPVTIVHLDETEAAE